MNKTLAAILCGRLYTLPYVQLYGGLVTTVSKADSFTNEGGTTRTVVNKFPIVTDLLATEVPNNCEMKMPYVMTPDTRFTGLLYFEDGGSTHLGNNNYQSSLRIVVWLNVPSERKPVCPSEIVALNIIDRLHKPFNQIFTKIRVTQCRINTQGDSNFSRYTYDEKILQYLMPPFEHISLDLTVEFGATLACLSQPYEIKPC